MIALSEGRRMVIRWYKDWMVYAVIIVVMLLLAAVLY
jgi:hypothetical protein